MSLFAPRRIAVVIGLVYGLVVGLVYAWGFAPIELVNVYPALLPAEERHDWIRLAALSYIADGSLERATTRLAGFEDEDVALVLEGLIESYVVSGYPARVLRSLTALAQAQGVYTPAMAVYIETPDVPTPTPTPASTPLTLAPTMPTQTPMFTASSTFTPSPTATSRPSPLVTSTPDVTPTLAVLTPTLTPTPMPTPLFSARLRLAGHEQVCGPLTLPRIEVVVMDEQGDQVAGVEVWLMWPGGADRAVTGLKPEYGVGYADFGIEDGVSYALGTSELGMPLVTGLQTEPCPVQGDQEPPMGSWRIVLAPMDTLIR